jgi:hypothetical protein
MSAQKLLTIRITPGEKQILANLANHQGVTVSEMLLKPYLPVRNFTKKAKKNA